MAAYRQRGPKRKGRSRYLTCLGLSKNSCLSNSEHTKKTDILSDLLMITWFSISLL